MSSTCWNCHHILRNGKCPACDSPPAEKEARVRVTSEFLETGASEEVSKEVASELAGPAAGTPEAKAHEIMETFWVRWGYISSAAREQEAYLAGILREVAREAQASLRREP